MPTLSPHQTLFLCWPLAEEADHSDPQPSTDWECPATSHTVRLCLSFPNWKREVTSTPASTGQQGQVGEWLSQALYTTHRLRRSETLCLGTQRRALRTLRKIPQKSPGPDLASWGEEQRVEHL